MHLFLDVQLFPAQAAVVDGDGSCCPISRVGIGGGVVASIKGDLTDLLGVSGIDAKLVCKHSLDLRIGQRAVRCFGEGIGNTAGNGFVASRFVFFRPGLVSGAGVSAVSVLGHIFVRGSIDGDRVGGGLGRIGRCVLLDLPVIVVGIDQRLIGIIGRGGGRGCGLGSAPIDLLHLVEVVADNFVARSPQIFNGAAFGVLLQQVIPCKLFLLFVGKVKGDIPLGDDVGLPGNGIAVMSLFHIGRRGHAGFISSAAFLLKTLGNGEGTARSMCAVDGGSFAIFPRDRTGSDIGAAAYNVVFDIVDLIGVLVGNLIFIGGSADLRRHFGTLIVQGIGLAVFHIDKVAAVRRIDLTGVLFHCGLGVGFRKTHFYQSFGQRSLGGFGLCRVFGFLFAANGFGFTRLRLLDLDGVRQTLADDLLLIHAQLSMLAVADIVHFATLGLVVAAKIVGDLFCTQLIGGCLVHRNGVLAVAIRDGVSLGHGGVVCTGLIEQLLKLFGSNGFVVVHGDIRQLELVLYLNRVVFRLGMGFPLTAHHKGCGGADGNVAVALLHLDIGGTGLLVAALVLIGLSPGQGIVAVTVHFGSFRINQLGNIFCGHFTFDHGVFLDQRQCLRVVRAPDILDRITALTDRCAYFCSIPVDAGIAQLFFQIDLFRAKILILGGRARCGALAGGRGGLGAGGQGGFLDINRAVRVLCGLFLAGAALVRNGLRAGFDGRLSGSGVVFLGLFGLTDLFNLGSLLAVTLGLLAVAFGLRLAVLHDIAGLGGGAVLVFRFGVVIHIYVFAKDFLGIVGFMVLVVRRRGISNGCRSRAFPFRLGRAVGCVIRDGVHIICRIRDQGLGRNTCGQCHRHCSNFKLFIRHDPRSPFLSPCV